VEQWRDRAGAISWRHALPALRGPRPDWRKQIPTLAASRERVRLEVAGEPAAMSDLYVLVIKRGEGRYLGRRNVLVEDGQPVLVLAGCRPLGAYQRSRPSTRWVDARCVPAWQHGSSTI
jgi:hypothetical protein